MSSRPRRSKVEGDSLCLSQITSKMGSWCGGGTSANTSMQEGSLEQVASFFDDRGFLGRETPTHWAVTACYNPSIQRSAHKLIESKVGIPLRQQSINAKRTIERDQKQREREIKLMTKQSGRPLSGYDAQHQRYLQLLFEPMQGVGDKIPQDLTMEFENEMGAMNRANDAKRRQTLKSLATLVKLGNLSFRSTSGLTKHDSREGHAVTLSFSSSQRARLINLSQMYITRVDRAAGADTMRRSTWFRFMHHCGILGAEDGPSVTFSQASSVFAMFSEAAPGGMHKSPTLTFGNWVTAIQHLLDGPKFHFKTQAALLDYLFGTWVTRCESRWADAPLPPGKAMQPHARKRGSRPWKKDQVDPAEGNFAWQVEVAEEQMCEPEVLQVLHEFEVPLQGLFAHYASIPGEKSPADSFPSSDCRDPVATSQGCPSRDGLCPPGSVYDEDLCDVPLDQSDGHLDRTIRGHEGPVRPGTSLAEYATSADIFENGPPNGAAQGGVMASGSDQAEACRDDFSLGTMSSAGFEQMLMDFELFPTIVQTHSANQHLQISLRRRECQDLTYPAFVECLCRIAFVYLGEYGNSVQQSAPAKRKCLWLMTWLQVGCQDLDIDVRPKGFRTSPPNTAWPRNSRFDLDHEPVQSLVLWKTLEAEMFKKPRPSS